MAGEEYDHKNKIYTGPLDYKKITRLVKRAYWIYHGQKNRNKVYYSTREFIYWWLINFKKKKWKRPHCGRIDHSKGYCLSNIIMQEQSENSKERNARRGNPCSTHRAVKAYTHSGKFIKEFKSKVAAAKYFNINEKTIYNHCEKVSKQFNNGPITKARKVTFQWAK